MNNTERENITKIINDKKVIEKFLYLYDRWEDEKKYEDFSDYVEAMMKSMPKDAMLIEGSETPFGVKFKYGGNDIRISLKFREGYCSLVAEMF